MVLLKANKLKRLVVEFTSGLFGVEKTEMEIARHLNNTTVGRVRKLHEKAFGKLQERMREWRAENG